MGPISVIQLLYDVIIGPAPKAHAHQTPTLQDPSQLIIGCFMLNVELWTDCVTVISFLTIYFFWPNIGGEVGS